MEPLREQLNDLSEKVGDIHKVIAGQPQYGQKGIKDTLDEHGSEIHKQSERILKLERSDNKRVFKAGAIGGGIGGVLYALFPKTWIAKLLTIWPF